MRCTLLGLLLRSHSLNFLVVCQSAQSYIYSLVACVDVDTLATRIQRTPRVSSAWPIIGSFLGREFCIAQIDVGSAPSVALVATTSGSTFLLETHADADCPGAARKHSAAAFCRRAPSSLVGTLGYNYASLGLWLSEMRSGSLFSSCSRNVFHGVYDQGSSPSVAMFAISESSAGVVLLHNGVPNNSSLNTSCGASATPFDGLVLDRFLLWLSPDTPRPVPDSQFVLPLWLILSFGAFAALVAVIVVSFVRANRTQRSTQRADQALLADEQQRM